MSNYVYVFNTYICLLFIIVHFKTKREHINNGGVQVFHVRSVTQGDVIRADAKEIPRIFQVGRSFFPSVSERDGLTDSLLFYSNALCFLSFSLADLERKKINYGPGETLHNHRLHTFSSAVFISS